MTGDGDKPERSKGAQKQADYRARKAAARDATGALATMASDLARAAAPVQAALPLSPVGPDDAVVVEAPAPGRPKGARNRDAADWRAYMLERYGSPLVVMAETFSRDVADLAAELGCKRLEAFQLQLKAASDLAGYLHSRAPQAVQLDTGGLAPVMLGVSAAMAAKLGMPAGPIIESVEDQRSSDDEAGEV